MSETVHYKGVLKQVIQSEGASLEDYAKDILRKMGVDYDVRYDSPMEQLSSEFYDSYFYYKKNDKLFEVTKENCDQNDEIIRAELNKDKSISYELKYYNGGAGFSECLEEAIDKLEEAL